MTTLESILYAVCLGALIAIVVGMALTILFILGGLVVNAIQTWRDDK